MDNQAYTQEIPREKSVFRVVYDFLSGFKLATVLLLLLLLLTWLATLEQVDYGLNQTLHKYFSWKSPYLIPAINTKQVPIILPGGYYVCALLLVRVRFAPLVLSSVPETMVSVPLPMAVAALMLIPPAFSVVPPE